MKWIFYLLLLINLGIFAWIMQQPPQDEVAIKSPLRDVGDLKMVPDAELKVLEDFQKRQQKQNASLSSAATTANGIDTVSESVIASGQCRRIGPFGERKTAVNIADSLAEYRLVAKIEPQVEINTLGYWAVLPALATREEADTLVEKLKSRGIRDVRRFTSGEMINAISLGLFSTEENARRRATSIENEGFVALVQPKLEEVTEFWLEFDLPQHADVPLESLRALHPQMQIKNCGGIAR